MNDSIPYNYIAIEGNIGAGKTTLSKMLAKKINGKIILEQFEENPFLPMFYKDAERYSFPVELFFLTERQKQLNEVLLKPELFFEFFVSDYIFIKTLLFAKNNLNKEEYLLFKRIYEVVSNTFPKPDIILYLHRPVEVLLQNIAKRGRNYEEDITSDYLKSVQDAYFEYFKVEKDMPILVLDLKDRDLRTDEKGFENLVELLKESHPVGLNIIDL